MKKFYPFLSIPLIVGLVVCQKPEEVGWIAVNSEPQGAAVYLDDSLTTETTNCVLEDVSVGEHALKLTLEDYVDWDTLVEVEAESPTTFTATMIPVSDTIDTVETGTLLWEFCGWGYPSPLLDNKGTTYAYLGGTSQDRLFSALDISDGSVKWQKAISVSLIGFDGNLYGAEGEYLCSYNSDGSTRWKIKLMNAGCASCKAIDESNTSYWSYQSQVDYSTYVIAFNSTCSEVWNYPLGGGWNYPVAIGQQGQRYVIKWLSNPDTVAWLSVIDQEGKLLWEYLIGNSWAIHVLCIGSDGTAYTLCTDIQTRTSSILAINQGQLVWQYDNTSYTTELVIGVDGVIYFGSDQGLCALSSNGNLKWCKNINTNIYAQSTPLLGEDGTIYYGGYDGLYAVDASNEAVKWLYKPQIGFVYGELALAKDGTLLVGIYKDEDSRCLHAIKTDSKGLANSSWPKYRTDNRCSGCAR